MAGYNHATSTYILIALTVVFGLVSGYVVFFGIPPELKKWLQEEALEYMGENKASYMTKAAIDNIPEGDQKELKQARDSIKNMGGGALQNPLGKFAGNKGDDAKGEFDNLTKGFK
ncbi:hypothetical protein LTR09_004723 [Extremus antarcticus]|uniref:Uncharacterized protein n=1 Tax=Extremus antarcticus TaxID=702011 RepID=A0AAJ0DPN1_9PEZI|nr:hypothetical protein LTR09_004723 [Extremus antarcticus]